MGRLGSGIRSRAWNHEPSSVGDVEGPMNAPTAERVPVRIGPGFNKFSCFAIVAIFIFSTVTLVTVQAQDVSFTEYVIKPDWVSCT